MKKLDCIIIGAGVVGASIARELSRYTLDTLVLEKEIDVGLGASGANSAIIHSGYDPIPGTLKAKLNVLGNEMYDLVADELSLQFKRIGSITIANNEEEIEILKELAKRSEENGVEYKLLNQEELFLIEPNITKTALMGLLCPTAGIINPFELVVHTMENAMDNGVKLNLGEEVVNIIKLDDGFKVITSKDEYLTKYVINASGVYSSKINDLVNEHTFTVNPRRGEYFVLDHFDDNYIKHTLFNVPSSKGKGVLVSPTTHLNYLVGPSSEYISEFDSVKTNQDILNNVKLNAKRLVDNIPYREAITEFAGLRSVSDTHDFVINCNDGFINAAGIESPGLTSAPAIAKMVSDFISDKIPNPNFNPRIRPQIRMNELSDLERNEIIKRDPRFGRIICRCEVISEGEILDAINRNCGARTVEGVKRRCRPGMGKCQGGFCQSLVLEILARELGCEPKDIMWRGANSYIVSGPTKENE